MDKTDRVSETKLSESEIYLAICEDNYNGALNPILEIAHTKERAFLRLSPSFCLEVGYTELIKSTRGKNVVFSIQKSGTLDTRAIPVFNVLRFSSRISSHIEESAKPKSEDVF